MKAVGMEVIKFSPADGGCFVDLAYSTVLEDARQKLSPESYAKFAEFIWKKP